MKITKGLNLSINYNTSWGLPEVFREIYSNALDGKLKSVTSTNHGSQVTFTSEDSITDFSAAMMLGVTTKSKDANQIGRFGEGLKVAIVAAMREGLTVKIESGKQVCTFLTDGKSSEVQYTITSKDTTTPGTVVTLNGNSPDYTLWDTFQKWEIKNVIPDRIEKDEYGFFLIDGKSEDCCDVKVYVGGILVNTLYHKLEHNKYPFDIAINLPPSKVKLNRDRSDFKMYELYGYSCGTFENITSKAYYDMDSNKVVEFLLRLTSTVSCDYISHYDCFLEKYFETFSTLVAEYITDEDYTLVDDVSVRVDTKSLIPVALYRVPSLKNEDFVCDSESDLLTRYPVNAVQRTFLETTIGVNIQRYINTYLSALEANNHFKYRVEYYNIAKFAGSKVRLDYNKNELVISVNAQLFARDVNTATEIRSIYYSIADNMAKFLRDATKGYYPEL